jgi:RNA polymerase sigma factor (sigma-70 family)
MSRPGVPPRAKTTMGKHPGSTLRTRPSLLFRVREPDDSVSWEEFHRLYRRLIYGRARRSGLSHADAEEVAQDVFKRVAQSIHQFDLNPERGSFRGWLMKLTHWRIADKFKGLPKVEAKKPARRGETRQGTATIDRVPAAMDDEDEWDREWRQHLLDAALERVAKRAKPLHFQVFDLYVRQGCPALKVSSELGVPSASVYVIGHRLTKQLKAEVESLRKQLG